MEMTQASSSTRIKYTSPISINTTTTLTFAAVDAVGNWGSTYSETYAIDLPPTVTATPAGGIYPSKNVVLTASEISVIYYTTDSSDPTISSTRINILSYPTKHNNHSQICSY